MNDSPLTETNCVIIPYKAMLSGDYSLASDLECLVTLKFTIVHLESVYFSQEMTKKIFCLLSLSRKVHTHAHTHARTHTHKQTHTHTHHCTFISVACDILSIHYQLSTEVEHMVCSFETIFRESGLTQNQH